MNTHDDRNDDESRSDTLRWQLRALRRDETPTRELWPDIAARLHTSRASRRRWVAPVAMAASLLLVVGVVGWFNSPRIQNNETASATIVQREADGLTRQYQAALKELAAAPASSSLQPTFDDLDRNAALIRKAIADDPDSRLLLEQLRRTYAHRLALAQRVAHHLA